MKWPNFPVIYEINTWAWLQQLGQKLGHPVTLGSVPDAELERIQVYGFDALWLMGIWQRSPTARQIAREQTDLQDEYRRTLPDYVPEDVVGSPYAVYCYQVDSALGGDAELNLLRQRLQKFGLGLILDFVPNHLARDHAWVKDHPERLLQGTSENIFNDPANYFNAENGRVFAHGRDPYFSGWTDTVQIDYRRLDTRRAISDLLSKIAERCDGVRCDMAMLVTRNVFLRTWGGEFESPEFEFWPEATAQAKARNSDLIMVAEVYWGLEYQLLEMGFDYAYDKCLYDRLLSGHAGEINACLGVRPEYRNRLVRFIENHDEQRALTAFGTSQRSRAAATLALNLPGMRLLHEGQLEGCRLKLPVQLGRRPSKSTEAELERFYRRLLLSLQDPVLHEGQWLLFAPTEAWPENNSYKNFIAYQWVMGEEFRVVVVNFSSDVSQCFVPLKISGLSGHRWYLRDLLGDAVYLRHGDDMLSRGLYLDMPACGYHLFKLEREQAG